MMQDSFSWLHVTDLHQGQRGQDLLIHRFQTALYADLRERHDETGPWDLVLFTGDLTQRGSREEFDALNDTLCELWAQFESWGSQPILLAVPGNHDLVRPEATDPRLQELARWPDKALVERFWSDPESPHRKLVAEAFANYTTWWNELPFPRARLHEGIMPGDFTVVVEKRGLRLGVMGLSSAFLQLADGEYQGRLDVSLQQFRDAAGGHPAEWKSKCHATLLLTHHSRSWLSDRAQRTFTKEIASNFEIHLYGHMHESELGGQRLLGSSHGYRWLQGRSLFGLERWGETEQRSHGYSVGRLSFQEDKVEFQIWPRMLVDAAQGMIPDHSVGDARSGFISESWPRKLRKPAVTVSVDDGAQPGLLAENDPFDHHWYVRRPDLESEVFHTLGRIGTPAWLKGPAYMGKTWLCKYVCHWIRNSVSRRFQVAEVQIGALAGRAAIDTLDSFLQALCLQVGDALGIDDSKVIDRWRRAQGGPKERAQALFEQLLLPSSQTAVVVAIDGFKSISTSLSNELFGLLRRWCDFGAKPPWRRLRLMLVYPRVPDLGTDQSPFTIAQEITVEGLSSPQMDELFSHYGLEDLDLARLHQSLDGDPRWLRMAAWKLWHKLKTSDRPKPSGQLKTAEVDLSEVIDDILATIVNRYRQKLARTPAWREVSLKIRSGEPLTRVPRATLDAMYDYGLIVPKGLELEYEFRMRDIMNAVVGE